MDKLIEILEDIKPGVDYEILSIVSELQDEFDIAITPADIIPENFNSATALWEMVCRLKD